MHKIVDEWRIENYTVLILDEDLLHVDPYNTFVIDGKKYKPVLVYDMTKCIAIEEKNQTSFIGKHVEISLVGIIKPTQSAFLIYTYVHAEIEIKGIR